MDQHAAFLQAICEEPDEDLHRLVYADWLEDRGDPASIARAELIRVQCRLSADRGMQGTLELFQRERDILADYEQQWVKDIGIPLAEWKFERGFIARVRVEVPILLEHAEQFFRQVPVQHLSLFWVDTPANRRSTDLGRLSAFPALQHLICLDMRHQFLSSACMEVRPFYEGLKRLRVLELSHNQIGDAGLRALIHYPLFSQLLILDLGYNDFTGRGIRALLNRVEELEAAGINLRLRNLILSDNSVSMRNRRIYWGHPFLNRVARWVH